MRKNCPTFTLNGNELTKTIVNVYAQYITTFDNWLP